MSRYNSYGNSGRYDDEEDMGEYDSQIQDLSRGRSQYRDPYPRQAAQPSSRGYEQSYGSYNGDSDEDDDGGIGALLQSVLRDQRQSMPRRDQPGQYPRQVSSTGGNGQSRGPAQQPSMPRGGGSGVRPPPPEVMREYEERWGHLPLEEFKERCIDDWAVRRHETQARGSQAPSRQSQNPMPRNLGHGQQRPPPASRSEVRPPPPEVLDEYQQRWGHLPTAQFQELCIDDWARRRHEPQYSQAPPQSRYGASPSSGPGSLGFPPGTFDIENIEIEIEDDEQGGGNGGW